MRGLTTARLALGLVAAATILGGPSAPAAKAQETGGSSLAGIQGKAQASGVAAAYRPENLLPIASPIDLSSPDALATIASGPSTFARASVADPGDLLANPDALLSLFSADYPQGTVPPYPFRVSASSGVGQPTAESNPAPGLNARVNADQKGSSAQATMPSLGAPAIATAGSITSSATTSTDGSKVTVHARTQVNNFNLLNTFTFESLVTDVTATSDGVKTDVAGTTTISGAVLAGTPVTVDSAGVQGAGKSLNDQLKAVGISISLTGPVEQGGDTAGQVTAAGLHIVLDSAPASPVIDPLTGLVPPNDLPLVEDLLQAARTRHLMYIDVGRGQASLVTRGTPIAQSVDTGLGSDLQLAPAEVGALGLVGGTDLPSIEPAPVSTGSGPAPAPLRSEPASTTTLAGGIGALAVLALLAQPFLGKALATFATTTLAPGAAGSCPREER